MKEVIDKYYVNKMKRNNSYNDIHVYKNTKLAKTQHIHDCYEIEVLISGEMKEVINGKTFTAKPGDMFFICPNDVHELVFDESPVIYNLMFRENVIGEKNMKTMRRFSPEEVCVTHLSEKDYEIISALIDKAIKEYCSIHDDLSEPIIKNVIGYAFLTIMRYHSDALSKSVDSRVEKALNYIDENFRAPITMLQISKIVGLEEDYFSSLFYKHTKMRFKSYLSKCRLNYACKMLLETDDTVADICYDSGFNSLATFHREFKAFFNCSPLEYRKSR